MYTDLLLLKIKKYEINTRQWKNCDYIARFCHLSVVTYFWYCKKYRYVISWKYESENSLWKNCDNIIRYCHLSVVTYIWYRIKTCDKLKIWKWKNCDSVIRYCTEIIFLLSPSLFFFYLSFFSMSSFSSMSSFYFSSIYLSFFYRNRILIRIRFHLVGSGSFRPCGSGHHWL